MASIRKEIPLAVPAADVWDAVRDIGALHHRLVKGFVTDTKLGNVRAMMDDGARAMKATLERS
jgi:hypothetical protein